jgi:hypothetical protein
LCRRRKQRSEAGEFAFDALPEFEIETPRNPQFGDYAANLAMLLAKQARRNPREVAEAIRQRLPKDAFSWVERVEVAGAGFLNFYLKAQLDGRGRAPHPAARDAVRQLDAGRGQARADRVRQREPDGDPSRWGTGATPPLAIRSRACTKPLATPSNASSTSTTARTPRRFATSRCRC